jgi:hypothetical protein
VSRDVVRLAPGADAFDTLTTDVPGNASSGEHYAVVWAQGTDSVVGRGRRPTPEPSGSPSLRIVSVGPVGASR